MQTKTHGFTVGYYRSPRCGSLQNVSGSNICAERTSWKLANFSNGVCTTLRTFWETSVSVELDIRRDVIKRNIATYLGIIFLCPLILCDFDLTQIIDAIYFLNSAMSRVVEQPNEEK